MFRLKLDIESDIRQCPEFGFETFKELANFMLICFKNGYDVYINEDEEE
jgi:hypothetical protein